jgi:Fe-S oxidoreductase
VQDEQMLDIIDIRRNQVMIEGEFPAQLQSAFRGMERAQNPWGINHEQRLAWADGLAVKTTDENPTPDVLYWVGCAASYDPQAQKTARAFVELLNHAEVNFAVLGKRECCTGDSARRAGNEYLYRQLADKNVATLNEVKPKLIVASCPHCMNSIGKEYRQIGGDYKVMHHTEYLETLVAQKRLESAPSEATITYHDPCYLGRHNGVYDAPRNLLHILGNEMVELGRNRENAFCCGAGGAQFWKEEEEGDERISDNRFREVQHTLASAEGEKVLAVGCPFCKSMLGSTPLKGESDVVIKDVAELLLEGVRRRKGIADPSAQSEGTLSSIAAAPIANLTSSASLAVAPAPAATLPVETLAVETLPVAAPISTAPVERKRWQPKAAVSTGGEPAVSAAASSALPAPVPIAPSLAASTPIGPGTTTSGAGASASERKKWQPKSDVPDKPSESESAAVASAPIIPLATPIPPVSAQDDGDTSGLPDSIQGATPDTGTAPLRKKWNPRKNESG